MSDRPTPEQLAEFDCAGCLVIRGFFEATECTDLRRWTEEIATAPELPGRHMVYYEDSLTEPGRRIVPAYREYVPVLSRLRYPSAARQSDRLGRRAARRRGCVVQGQDQFQAAGWRRFRAASGPAGR